MTFDLIENKKLILFCGEMMKDGDTKNVIVLRQMFPKGFFSNICFVKFVFRMSPFGFFEKLFANIQPRVLGLFGKAKKQTTITTAHVKNRRARFNVF